MDKFEYIENMLNQGIEKANDLISSIGGEILVIDDIDKKILVDSMVESCSVSIEEIQNVENFLNSETYKKYSESMTAISKVVFDGLSKKPVDNKVH